MHVEPAEAGRPFVILGQTWAWKAYRLTELERVGTLKRIRREAEVALELDSIDGVVGASHVDESDGWLVLRMLRMPGTLEDHLVERERGMEKALSADDYARLLAGVGETLRRLHRRGIVHRDIKPANLLFGSDRQQLHVCDFSVVKTRRSELTQTGVALGTDSYIAPELWRTGESSPVSDQYSLGIVAREVFTGNYSAALPRPLADVLRTATAADPADRYPGVDGCRAFGEALARAVKAEAPRTLADRLRDASPATRFAWAPGAFGALGYWIKVILDRNPDVIPGLETLLLPLLAGFLAFTVTRVVNLPRGRRSQSGATFLSLWWPPWLIVAAFLYVGGGLHGGTEWFVILGIPIAFAFAGSYPPRCGYWLPALIERGSRTAMEHGWLRPLRSVLAQFVAVGVVLLLAAFAPVWAARAFPAPYGGPTGLDSGALQVVAAYRAAVFRGNVQEACAMMDNTIKTSSPCARWMKAQVVLARESRARARWRAGHNSLFDRVPLRDIELVRLGTEKVGRTVYSLAYSGGAPSETIRTFGDLLTKGEVANVIVADGPAVEPKQIEGLPVWYYELHRRASIWRVTFTNICSGGAPTVEGMTSNRCLSAMRISPGAITKLLARSN